MDLTSAAEERKADESGGVGAASPHLSLTASPQPSLTPGVANEMMSYLTPDQLRSIVAASIIDPPAVLDRVRSVADEEPAQRRLLIRGLGYETTADTLRSIFFAYGEVTDVVVIYNEATGKSKRFGFITFKHLDGALLANSEPIKQIDGHVTDTQLVRLPSPVAPVARAAPGGEWMDVTMRWREMEEELRVRREAAMDEMRHAVITAVKISVKNEDFKC